MELFTIHCTTCKARLVVRNESVIGEILSCPKCNSMVQVVPPVGWKRPGSGDGSPSDLSIVGQAPQPPAPSNEPPTAEPRAVEMSVKKVAAAAIPPALPPRSAAATAVPASSPAPATLAAPICAEAGPTRFAMAVARAKRDWILLSGGLVGGVALGVAVWLAVAAPTPAPVVADAPLEDRSSAELTVPPASKSSQPAKPPPELPRKHAQAVAAEAPTSVEPAGVITVPRAAPKAASPQAVEPPPASAAPNPAPQKPGPSLKLEPISSGVNLASGTAQQVDVDEFLPSAAASSAGNSTAQELVPLDGESADAEIPPDASPGTPGPLSREEINRRLSISLAEVEFAGVPLAQFAAFIADVSGVPVTLDEAALATAGQGPRTPITVKLTKTTAGEALREAVTGAGLSVTLAGGRIVVTRGEQ